MFWPVAKEYNLKIFLFLALVSQAEGSEQFWLRNISVKLF